MLVSGIEGVTFRMAVPGDAADILSLIRELAVYERMLDQVYATEDDIVRTVFGERKAEVIMVERAGEAIGFALFFSNYSTFLGKAGLYLEDIYIQPKHRNNGIGGALMRTLAKVAVSRGWGRMEWSCLDWNEPSIAFYTQKLKAVPMSDWTTYRLSGETLERAAKG